MLAITAMSASSGSAAPPVASSITVGDTVLAAIAFGDLQGWPEDDHAAAFQTFLASCRALTSAQAPRRAARPTIAALRAICADALSKPPTSARGARSFFETKFQPFRIRRQGDSAGFVTGYFEPEVAGSRTRTGSYVIPLLAKPDDLVSVGDPAAPIIGRRVGGKIAPYHARAAIEDGALAGRGLELVWLKDPVDAFFIHVQGSARIRLPDGQLMRVNYAARNGHPYVSVGRILVERGEVPLEQMTLDRIRAYVTANPADGRALLRHNPSYVFFREEKGLDPDQHAPGGQGVPLTPLRSIAIDRTRHAYGTPMFIDATLPLRGDASADPFRRLMIGQDTGTAIVGPARADIYFGAGAAAGAIAGRIRHPATFTVLLPRGLDPNVAFGSAPTTSAR